MLALPILLQYFTANISYLVRESSTLSLARTRAAPVCPGHAGHARVLAALPQVNTVCVGRLDEPELLSALVLATSLATATGYNVISGISITTESVCGAAYGKCPIR